MSTESGVSLIEGRPRAPAGAIRYRDGQTVDRWRRTEEQVKEQRKLAQEIAEAITVCRERATELEPGRTLGDRQLRRLEVAARGFERLMERDSQVLREFKEYAEAERQESARRALLGRHVQRHVRGTGNGAAA